MIFRDRDDAATRLTEQLMNYRGMNPLVLAIPRGAVPMAKIIADKLQGEMDIILVRKLGAPGNPELAVGAIDETGWTYVTQESSFLVHDSQYIKDEKARQLAILHERRKYYTPFRPPLDPLGRIVIIVDDGLATGSTMIAALHALRAKSPKQLIGAIPVAPPEALARVAPFADDIVCLEIPSRFSAVGQFYQTFAQVSDQEVIALLKQNP